MKQKRKKWLNHGVYWHFILSPKRRTPVCFRGQNLWRQNPRNAVTTGVRRCYYTPFRLSPRQSFARCKFSNLCSIIGFKPAWLLGFSRGQNTHLRNFSVCLHKSMHFSHIPIFSMFGSIWIVFVRVRGRTKETLANCEQMCDTKDERGTTRFFERDTTRSFTFFVKQQQNHIGSAVFLFRGSCWGFWCMLQYRGNTSRKESQNLYVRMGWKTILQSM